MIKDLLISVRLHDGRFHGAGEIVPSPARLFQALVAAAGIDGPLNSDESEALSWLETLAPHPIVAIPRMISASSHTNFVPDNLLDAMDGDPRRIAKIRSAKAIKARIFDSDIPLLYSWRFPAGDDTERKASLVCSLAEQLYQFGRGVDFAWAWGEVIETEAVEVRLLSYPGIVYRPSGIGDGIELPCPQPGSLKSLQERYQANSRGFVAVRQGKAVKQFLSQPSKPRFAQVAYDSPPARTVYELRESTTEALIAWPLSREQARRRRA